jgi:hypothetical protein
VEAFHILELILEVVIYLVMVIDTLLVLLVGESNDFTFAD